MSYLQRSIDALSKRYHLTTEHNTDHIYRTDAQTNEENLLYGVSNILGRLIYEATLPSLPTEQDLHWSAKEFNIKNNSNVDPYDIVERGWLRIINGQVRISMSLMRAIFDLRNNRIEVPDAFINDMKFLDTFDAARPRHDHPLVSHQSLTFLSKDQIDFLKRKECIVELRTGQKYRVSAQNFGHFLQNEICAVLWSHLYNDSNLNGKDKISEFIRRTEVFNISIPHNIGEYLNLNKQKALRDSAFEVLMNEEDVKYSNSEFYKVWFDSPMYTRRGEIFNPVPKNFIDYSSSYAFLLSIGRYDSNYPDLYESEDTRLLHDLLLELIIQLDDPTQNYPAFRQVIQDITRPYLVYRTFQRLKRRWKYLIPYTLLDPSSIEIGLLATHHMEINRNLRIEDQMAQDQMTEDIQTQSDLWLKLYELFLDTVTEESPITDESVHSLYAILRYQSMVHYWPQARLSLKQQTERGRRLEEGFKLLTRLRHTHSALPWYAFILDRLLTHLTSESFPATVGTFTLLDLSRLEFALQLRMIASRIPIIEKSVPFNVSEFFSEIDKLLQEIVTPFFTEKTYKHIDRITGESSTKNLTRYHHRYGEEIIDWGPYWIFLDESGLYNSFISKALSSIQVDDSEKGQFSDVNQESLKKIRFLLKAIGIGIVQIDRYTSKMNILSRNTIQTRGKLMGKLKELTTIHIKLDLKKCRLNAFTEKNFGSFPVLFEETPSQVVFSALASLGDEDKSVFLSTLLKEEIDLLLLLEILNTMNDPQSKNIISEVISSIDVEQYLKSTSNFTTWKNTLIEAIRSDKSFDFVETILERIEEHLERVPMLKNRETEHLFELKLALATKNKDLETLKTVQMHKANQAVTFNRMPPDEIRRQFYMGIHYVYNAKQPHKAIEIFEKLHSLDPDNVEFAYRLYHARTIEALEKNNADLFHSARTFWDDFFKDSKDENELKRLQLLILFTHTFHASFFLEIEQVRYNLSKLHPDMKYYSGLIESVYLCLSRKSTAEESGSYLYLASTYYVRSGEPQPSILTHLLSIHDDSKELALLKDTFSRIRDLSPEKIIQTIPERLNGNAYNLTHFISEEVVRAGKLMNERVVSLSAIQRENKYNDLILAILKMRLAVWGWSIQDQGRVGISTTGVELGESDFLVASGEQNLCLIEAMTLTGKNKRKTREHVLKCFTYVNHLTEFIMLTYFLGNDSKFNDTWKKYKTDVESICYSSETDIIGSFEDLTDTQQRTRSIQLGKTKHKSTITMLHVFINIPQ
ncbi:MAG: hypothetical protein NXI10_03535 [bacterium]|nr:hypothetical protein [bacterium]